MTTLEPGANVVFTHGLRDSPASTAFFASSAAPIITDGLDVFVHDVIAAITTAPWSRTPCSPSAKVTSCGFELRPSACSAADGTGVFASDVPGAAGSEAGNDSSLASSTP